MIAGLFSKASSLLHVSCLLSVFPLIVLKVTRRFLTAHFRLNVLQCLEHFSALSAADEKLQSYKISLKKSMNNYET